MIQKITSMGGKAASVIKKKSSRIKKAPAIQKAKIILPPTLGTPIPPVRPNVTTDISNSPLMQASVSKTFSPTQEPQGLFYNPTGGGTPAISQHAELGERTILMKDPSEMVYERPETPSLSQRMKERIKRGPTLLQTPMGTLAGFGGGIGNIPPPLPGARPVPYQTFGALSGPGGGFGGVQWRF